MKPLLYTENYPSIIFRIIVGLTFLSEGIQKFLLPLTLGTGRFDSIGFAHPAFWAHFTACFEIACSLLVLFGIVIRLSAIPLLIVMITAFLSTKLPLLIESGFWKFAHEYRTDFAMTLLLIYLIIHGAGRLSFDAKWSTEQPKNIRNYINLKYNQNLY